MEPIELQEWGAGKPVDVTEAERAALDELSGFLNITSIAPSRVVVKANNDFVGSVVLSDRLRIIVTPKVGISDLLDMVMLAAGLEPPPTLQSAGLYSSGNVVDWLAYMLALEVRRLLASGLRNAYVSTTERLAVIRGRIDFSETTKRPLDISTVTCRYAPFTIDTRENQIIRWALESLLLQPLHSGIKLMVQQTADNLRDVSLKPISLEIFETVNLTRLNAQYGAALALCKLCAEGSGLDFAGKSTLGGSFFISMNALFERALTSAVRKRIAGAVSQASFTIGRRIAGHPDMPITIRPDITIVKNGRPLLVIDAKYRKPIDVGPYRSKSYNSGNVYQIIAYAHALDCPGLLIYPKFDEDVDVTFQDGQVAFRIKTIDLGKGAAAEMDRLSMELDEVVSSLPQVA